MIDAVVIGVGSEYRHDDGVGASVIARLAATDLGDGVRLVELDGEPSRMIDAWEGCGLAVIVDAVTTGAAAGTIHRFAAESLIIAPSGSTSSHSAGFGEALRLGEALGRLPDRVVVFGIEGVDFTLGVGLSPAAAAAIDPVVAAIRQELDEQAGDECRR